MSLRYLLVYTLLAPACSLINANSSSSPACLIPSASNNSKMKLRQEVTNLQPSRGIDQLNGAHIKVGFHKSFSSDDSVAMFSKTLLADLSKYHNFTYTIRPGHTIQGELSAIRDGLLDLEIGFFTYTHQRASMVRFLIPLLTENYVIVIKRPRQKTEILNILDPFDTYIWVCLLAYLLVATLITAAMERWSHKDSGLEGNTESTQGIVYYVVYMFGSFLQQGGVSLPRTISTRILLSMWWLFVLNVCALYGGHLFSSLTVKPAIQYPFETLHEFALHPSITPTSVEGWAIFNQMQQQPSESDLGTLWQKISADERAVVSSTDTALELVLTGEYAFISDEIGTDAIFRAQYAATGTCSLAVAPIKIRASYLSWFVQHGSKYEQGLNIGLQRYKESGLFTHHYKMQLPVPPDCSQVGGMTVHARNLHLHTMSGILLVLLIGLIPSLLCLLLEVIVKRNKRNARRHRKHAWRKLYKF
ncbi:PREDICTED: glutamate receptor ionotropic, delta-1-like [Priapulus caudatus]|uniref:Glutamate receptor ionotropic, delta-1-like n=1 Tax=Priapulus caudatus TaxID=37621 RepID=A0ABM1E356_PRICU|nr:PREDICTED: glutamate receptor ionotropic, delta-1-like [Priapulus caudatus]